MGLNESLINNRIVMLIMGNAVSEVGSKAGLFFSRFSANTGKFIFRNLEFRQQILEFRKKSLNFHGEILRKPLSLD